MQTALFSHPTTPCPAITSIEAIARYEDQGDLSIRYVVHGAIEQIRWPAADTATRTDKLWEHTCFEAFVRAPNDRAYVELNFAPSTRWAAYRFDDYRSGMLDLEIARSPRIACQFNAARMEMEVRLSLDGLATAGNASCKVALSAVIEDRSGHKSYWALAHPSPQPDFHHADAFTVEIGRKK